MLLEKRHANWKLSDLGDSATITQIDVQIGVRIVFWNCARVAPCQFQVLGLHSCKSVRISKPGALAYVFMKSSTKTWGLFLGVFLIMKGGPGSSSSSSSSRVVVVKPSKYRWKLQKSQLSINIKKLLYIYIFIFPTLFLALGESRNVLSTPKKMFPGWYRRAIFSLNFQAC